ncbi:hypothetical protein JCM2811A_11810 [Methylorubrum rhodinum]
MEDHREEVPVLVLGKQILRFEDWHDRLPPLSGARGRRAQARLSVNNEGSGGKFRGPFTFLPQIHICAAEEIVAVRIGTRSHE